MPKNKTDNEPSIYCRTVTLGEINVENVNETIQFIEDINYIDNATNNKQREPIKIIINSTGGDVYHGLGLVDCIDNSITPIHTICYGCAFSMALPILASGHYRQASKRSSFMYHEILYSTDYEKLTTHTRELSEGKRILTIYDDILIKNTGLTKKILDRTKKQGKDWYFGVEEALKYKIINEII